MTRTDANGRGQTDPSDAVIPCKTALFEALHLSNSALHPGKFAGYAFFRPYSRRFA
jgi:hypothetical protein